MKIQLNKKYEAYNEKKRKVFLFEFMKDVQYNTTYLIFFVYNDDSEKTVKHRINTQIKYSDDIDIYFEQHYDLSLFKNNDIEMFINFSNSEFYSKYVQIKDVSYLVTYYKKIIAVDSEYKKIKSEYYPKIDDIKIFYDNNKNIFMYKNKYGIIDCDGNVLVDFIYDKIDYKVLKMYDKDVNEQIIVKRYNVCKDGLYGVLDENLILKIPTIYKEILTNYSFKNHHKDILVVKNVNDKYGVVNIDNEILLDFDYDEISNSKDNNTQFIKKIVNDISIDDLYEQNKLKNNIKKIYEND